MDRNIYLHFFWFRQVLLDHYGSFEIAGYPEMIPLQAVTRYMNWAIFCRFLHTFGKPDPIAGIILRPVNEAQLVLIQAAPLEHFCEFDVHGDTVWIDFAHAPGNTPFLVDFVQKCGYPYVSWHNARRDHPVKFHVEHLCRVRPFRSGNGVQAESRYLLNLDLP
jgi:hypothetical protein